MMNRFLSLVLALALLLTCGAVAEDTGTAEVSVPAWSGFSMECWNYNTDADVYWQVGISYCESPADAAYETLGIYVPGAYFDAVQNADGTYTCTVNAAGTLGGYTAATAPVVLPVNTPGYSAMAAPTGYTSEAGEYCAQGFIYVSAGCRGRDSGAPAGVTDLKAAIRFVRALAGELPGDYASIFTFGHSGGGAQSALLGVTGDSALYTPYLEAIGAVMETSDAVKGSMCWCPITNLDVADAAYEWNLGVTRSGLTDEEQAISDRLAAAFAEYINALGLTDENGNALTLEASETGIYQAGSYYEYIKGVIEASLENFLADTSWPYSASSSSGMGGMGGMPGKAMDGSAPADMGTLPDGSAPSDAGTLPDGQAPADTGTQASSGASASDNGPSSGESASAADNISRNATSGGLTLSGTYASAQDYIDALNADGEWVSYDAATGKVTITDVASFVKNFKLSSKSLGAFDQLDRGQGENELFGCGNGSAHFDTILAQILTDLGADEAADYAEDLTLTDALGTDLATRMNMYDPMYYLCGYYGGQGTSTVAPYFRIRTGIQQSDTALCTEVDLALALESYGVNVDFETVWGQGHTQAERTGDSASNFIAWVNQCMIK